MVRLTKVAFYFNDGVWKQLPFLTFHDAAHRARQCHFSTSNKRQKWDCFDFMCLLIVSKHLYWNSCGAEKYHNISFSLNVGNGDHKKW